MNDFTNFKKAAVALVGREYGWQTAIARRLKIHNRTVRRWIADGTVPGWALAAVQQQIELREKAKIIDDRWIWAVGLGSGQEYVSHKIFPRFTGRIVRGPSDMEIREIRWRDTPPTDAEIKTLLREAAEALAKSCPHA